LKYSDVAAPSAASRGWKLEVAPNGVHYSIGGKLTSAREDAVSIVDSLCARLGVERATATQGRPFPWKPERSSVGASSGATIAGMQSRAVQLGLDEECAVWLVRRHGRRANAVLDIVEGDARMGQRIVRDIAITYADLLYCAREEMVVHLADLLRHRTPLLILARLGEPELREIAAVVAPALGWDAAAIEREIKDCANP
jgi:glycerol-3-phosphate dehydrogenase